MRLLTGPSTDSDPAPESGGGTDDGWRPCCPRSHHWSRPSGRRRGSGIFAPGGSAGGECFSCPDDEYDRREAYAAVERGALIASNPVSNGVYLAVRVATGDADEAMRAAEVAAPVGDMVTAHHADGRRLSRGTGSSSVARGRAGSRERRQTRARGRRAAPERTARMPRHLRAMMRRIMNQSAAGGNRGISGRVTPTEARQLGERFVGPGYRVAGGGGVLISANGLRQFRLPATKRRANPVTGEPWSRTGFQVNFESRAQPSGEFTSNVHLDVTRLE